MQLRLPRRWGPLAGPKNTCWGAGGLRRGNPVWLEYVLSLLIVLATESGEGAEGHALGLRLLHGHQSGQVLVAGLQSKGAERGAEGIEL